jgi:hypothetical protein
MDNTLQGMTPDLTIADLCERYKRHPEFFRRLARERKIPCYQDGHGIKAPYRFVSSEIEAWWGGFNKKKNAPMPWRGGEEFSKSRAEAKAKIRAWRLAGEAQLAAQAGDPPRRGRPGRKKL